MLLPFIQPVGIVVMAEYITSIEDTVCISNKYIAKEEGKGADKSEDKTAVRSRFLYQFHIYLCF